MKSVGRIGRGRVGRATVVAAASLVLMSGCAALDTDSNADDNSSGSGSGSVLSNTSIPKPDKDDSIADMLPDEISERGYLTVASEVYPTAVIVPPDGGAPQGWEISTGEAIGAVLGIEFRTEVVPFDAIVPGLEAQRFDAAMGSITVTEERIAVVDFVLGHVTRDSLMVNADADFKPESMLDMCGKRLGILAGSIQFDAVPTHQAACTDEGLPEIEVQTFKAITEATLALSSGRIDAQGASTDSNVYAMVQQEGKFEITSESEFEQSVDGVPPGGSGVVLARHDYTPELAEAISAALQSLIDDGTHQAILDKWNEGKGGVDEATVFLGG